MKIAFVTPWYGPEIPGGMESETRRTAANLQAAGFQVEILTSCIHDFFSSWDKNHHQPGLTMEQGIAVRRFPVEATKRNSFQWANWRLQQGQQLTCSEEEAFVEQMINCPRLYEYIKENCHDTFYFFIPYLFSTTIYGSQICPEHSAIIPCLHDESYAYLDIFKKVLPAVKTLILHNKAELALVERLFGPNDEQLRRIIGGGVDTEFESNPRRFRDKFELSDPFMLVVGRRGRGKNTPLLLHYWRRFLQELGSDAKLLLIGPGEVIIDEDLADYVVDLGYVTTQDKYDAYAAATLLCQPSINESFSLVIMEAWLAGTPVLVNGHCAVTTEHCVRSNGGLYFTTYPEFAAAANYLFTEESVRRKMGENGRAYVLENYQWPTIVEKYRQLIGEVHHAG